MTDDITIGDRLFSEGDKLYVICFELRKSKQPRYLWEGDRYISFETKEVVINTTVSIAYKRTKILLESRDKKRSKRFDVKNPCFEENDFLRAKEIPFAIRLPKSNKIDCIYFIGDDKDSVVALRMKYYQ